MISGSIDLEVRVRIILGKLEPRAREEHRAAAGPPTDGELQTTRHSVRRREVDERLEDERENMISEESSKI